MGTLLAGDKRRHMTTSMLRTITALLVFLFSALVFWGCSSPEAPSIVSLSDVQLDSFSDLRFSLTLRNANPKKIKIRHVTAELWLDDSPVAELRLREPITLPKQSETTVSNSLAIQFRTPADELRLMFAIASWQGHKWEVSLSAKGRYGLMPFYKTIARTSYDALRRELQLPAFP